MNQNILQNWGQAQRQMPSSQAELKAKIFAEFSKIPKIEPKGFSFKLPVFVFSSAFVLVLLVALYNSEFQNKSTLPKDTSLLALNSPAVNKSIPTFKPSQAPMLEGSNPDSRVDLYNDSRDQQSMSGNLLKNQEQGVAYNLEQDIQRQVPVNDTREFLKMSYFASVNSLHVTELSDSITSSLKGLDGRVDSVSTSEESAHISFVLPQNHLDSFKLQLKTLAGKKFVIENISAENKLADKQVIEKTHKSLQDQLKQVQDSQQQTIEAHNKTVAGFNSQINSLSKQLILAKQNLSANPMNMDLQNQVTSLEAQLGKVKNSLAYENSNYQDQMSYFSSSIESINQSILDVKQDDQNLLDSVATVSGTITIYKINWVEYLNIYFPFYFSLPIILLLIAGVYAFGKRKSILIP